MTIKVLFVNPKDGKFKLEHYQFPKIVAISNTLTYNNMAYVKKGDCFVVLLGYDPFLTRVLLCLLTVF